MDPRKLNLVMDLDTRYLERRNVRGKVGWAWNNRHAAKLGIKSEWLGYDKTAAMQRADELNKMYDAERRGVSTHAEGSLGWWLKKVEKTREHNDRPDKVRNEVENAFKRLRETPLITAQLKDITGKHCKMLAGKLADTMGVSMSHRTMKWLRFVLGLAKEDGQIATNPLQGVRIPRAPARQVIVWDDEVEALIAHFRACGRFSLALAVRLAYDTTQRSDDLITLSWTRWNNGDMRVKQSKTKTTVLVPALPELRAMVAEIDRTKLTATSILINEETGRPYTESNFSHLINDGFRALGLTDEETGKPKVFRDLRRSGVVRLALAGCTILEIGSITGHSYTRIEQILETYLPRTTALARAAIERVLATRRAAEGVLDSGT